MYAVQHTLHLKYALQHTFIHPVPLNLGGTAARRHFLGRHSVDERDQDPLVVTGTVVFYELKTKYTSVRAREMWTISTIRYVRM